MYPKEGLLPGIISLSAKSLFKKLILPRLLKFSLEVRVLLFSVSENFLSVR